MIAMGWIGFETKSDEKVACAVDFLDGPDRKIQVYAAEEEFLKRVRGNDSSLVLVDFD